MSFTPYLSSIAEALMKRVYPHLEDARARDALEACVRALAGVGAAFEVPSPENVAALPLPAGIDVGPILLITDPPENLAASDQTAARITAGQAWLQSFPWVGNAAATSMAKAMVNWERETIVTKIQRMNAVEDQLPVADGDLAKLQIDRAALENYMRRRFGTSAKITTFRQAVGGRSRQTAVFSLEGTTLPARLVVQRDHPASIARDGIAQQYPVIELLSKTELKISRPVLFEADHEILGAPFMILEAASGTVAGLDYFRPPAQPDLAIQLAQQLAILHAADPTPLQDTLRCTVNRADANGWAAELAAIRTAWKGYAHAPSLTIAAAFSWMQAHVGQIGSELAIVHNDAAFHNILIEDGQFTSLLDFELVHLGHPAEDLGYCRPFIQEIADWDEFVDAYVAAGGTRYDNAVLDYFSLRGGIHLLTLLQYGRNVFKSGVTTDINLAEVATSFIPKQYGRVARMVSAVLAGNNS